MLHSDALSLSLTGMRLILSLFYFYCWLCPSFLIFPSSTSCFVDVIPHLLSCKQRTVIPLTTKGLQNNQKKNKTKNIYYSVCPGKGSHKKGRRADKEVLPHCRCLTQTEEKETGHVQKWPRSACFHCAHVFQNACFTTQNKPGSATLCFVQATNEATTLNLPPRRIPLHSLSCFYINTHPFLSRATEFGSCTLLTPYEMVWR